MFFCSFKRTVLLKIFVFCQEFAKRYGNLICCSIGLMKLDLSLNLVLDIARDSYATTLNRNGRSINHIAEHLGHATTVVTQHYVGQLTVEQSKEINSCLY